MKNNFAHRVLALGLSLMVLFSTVSFSVEKRYCGSDLKEVSVFFMNHEHQESPCSDNQVTIAKGDCCIDVVEFVQRDEIVQNMSFEDTDVHQETFDSTQVFSFESFFLDTHLTAPNFKTYVPPNLVVDKTIHHQVFLI